MFKTFIDNSRKNNYEYGAFAEYTTKTEKSHGASSTVSLIGAKVPVSAMYAFPLSDNVTLDASIEITGGNRHKPKEIDEPTAFSISLFYNFD